MTYDSEVLADSPLVYYKLDESSGSTLTDSSGNGRNGTYSASGVTYGATGLVADGGTAASATSGIADIADAAWMDVGTGGLTVEAWVKPANTTSTKGLVSRYLAAMGGWLLWHSASTSRFGFLVRDTADRAIISPTNFVVGDIYHLVGTYDPADNKSRLYVNGSLVATSATLAWNGGSLTIPIQIGRYNNANASADTIDNVAIYGSALSGTRIAAHYAAGASADASVAPPAASATASAVVPVVSVDATVSAVAATATATAVTPAVTSTGDATILVPSPASATASVLPPSLSWSASLSAAVATATAAALVPTVSGTANATVTAVAAHATAAAVAPAISSGSPDATVDAVAATATADAVAPVITATIVADTDTSNMLDGLNLGARGVVTITRAAVTPPTNVGVKQDKALAYPLPVMVNGRPT